jgi:hypothetical protein
MEVVYLFGFAAWVVAAWKWGKWNNLQQYLSTIYFMIMGNLLYSYLTGMHMLWSFESPNWHINNSFFELILIFLVYPCVVILFLSHYPIGWMKQVLYNLLYIFVFISNEWIAYKLGVFSYHDGWNIWWSLLVDSLIFPMLRLNQVKPVIAYLLFLLINLLFFIRFGKVGQLP